ncbi:hypothetical protein SDC9_167829 [bioreactor metagenome]|uniref:Uncharacterized protein n=1 Tax=bioreactor metagenome TaxID=1076179 RepID=A0A645G3F9_9ZZZZ
MNLLHCLCLVWVAAFFCEISHVSIILHHTLNPEIDLCGFQNSVNLCFYISVCKCQHKLLFL